MVIKEDLTDTKIYCCAFSRCPNVTITPLEWHYLENMQAWVCDKCAIKILNGETEDVL